MCGICMKTTPRTHWTVGGLLGLLVGCQAPEPKEPLLAQQPQQTTQPTDTARKILCYFPESCFQITELTESSLRVSDPALKGRILVSFVIHADLQISQEQVRRADIVWKSTGKPRFTGASTTDSAQLQRLLPLVRPVIHSLHIQRSNLTDRRKCSQEPWMLPITFE